MPNCRTSVTKKFGFTSVCKFYGETNGDELVLFSDFGPHFINSEELSERGVEKKNVKVYK